MTTNENSPKNSATPRKAKEGIFAKIFNGKHLMDERITNNAGLFILIIIYMLLYVGNRYVFQQELHTIANLKTEVTTLKYDVLDKQSELSEKGRKSHIEKYIKENNSELRIATQPPYVIK